MSYPKLLLIGYLSTKVPEKTPEERIFIMAEFQNIYKSRFILRDVGVI